MNRWSKYGGIMPETINISELTYTEGYQIRANGSIAATPNAHYTNNLFLKSGNYTLKFYYDGTVDQGTFRIHEFTNSGEWVKQLGTFNNPTLTGEGIVTINITMDNDGFIRCSMRPTVFLMEIEKL